NLVNAAERVAKSSIRTREGAQQATGTRRRGHRLPDCRGVAVRHVTGSSDAGIRRKPRCNPQMRPPLVLGAALLVTAGAACGSSRGTAEPSARVVPNVVGLRATDAVAKLADAGLCISWIAWDPARRNPPDRVIRQTPVA